MKLSLDTDWLDPDLTSPAYGIVRTEPFNGVWRRDDDEAEPEPCGSLMASTCAPPASPYATIYAGGVKLACSSDERAVWLFTGAGLRRLALEQRVVKALLRLDLDEAAQ